MRAGKSCTALHFCTSDIWLSGRRLGSPIFVRSLWQYMVSGDVYEENPSQAKIQSEKGGIWGDDFLLWYNTHIQPVVVS